MTTLVPTAADARLTRIEDLLRQVPGLQVLARNDGTYVFRIRGSRSIQGNATDDEPLLVIDGIPAGQGALGPVLASVAPSDVARIDVLKDAAATGAYGSRGANGVIVITTKRAR